MNQGIKRKFRSFASDFMTCCLGGESKKVKKQKQMNIVNKEEYGLPEVDIGR